MSEALEDLAQAVRRAPTRRVRSLDRVGGIGTVLLVAAVSACILVWILKFDPTPPTHTTQLFPTVPPGPPLQVMATDLYREFEANALAAEARYKNSPIIVAGQVSSIGRDPAGGAYVVLEGAGLLGIQCGFDKAREGPLLKIAVGQTVLVRAQIEGKFANVMAKDCELLGIP